jgi:cell division protein ZapE
MSLQSPQTLYRELLDNGSIIQDIHQAQVVEALDQLWHEIALNKPRPVWRRWRGAPPEPPRGLYLWGSVGRGKTWLMDLFYDHLPSKSKQRVHFHRFMQRIHAALRSSGKVRDPLSRIGRSWARECRVLCLDEFYVSDIGDAMLLAGLLESLFANGVTLLTTSNIEPEGLYKGGLQRAKFLPAIDLIRQHMRVMHMEGDTDFRLRILEQSEIYHHPLDAAAHFTMNDSFERMAAGVELAGTLDINGREFQAERRGDGIIWFSFGELCEKARGGIDYIEIARSFNTVMLSGVPVLADEHSNATRRFITLVDEFYDRNVKLLISADAPIDELYTGQRLAFEFQRTVSRLTEMQSHDYLARPHLP